MAGVKGRSGGKRVGAGRKKNITTGKVVEVQEIEQAVAVVSGEVDVLSYHSNALRKANEILNIGINMVRMGNVEAFKAFMPLLVKLAPALTVSKISLKAGVIAQSNEDKMIQMADDNEIIEWIDAYRKQLSKSTERIRAEAEA